MNSNVCLELNATQIIFINQDIQEQLDKKFTKSLDFFEFNQVTLFKYREIASSFMAIQTFMLTLSYTIQLNILIDSRLTVYNDVHEVIFTFVSNIE